MPAAFLDEVRGLHQEGDRPSTARKHLMISAAQAGASQLKQWARWVLRRLSRAAQERRLSNAAQNDGGIDMATTWPMHTIVIA